MADIWKVREDLEKQLQKELTAKDLLQTLKEYFKEVRHNIRQEWKAVDLNSPTACQELLTLRYKHDALVDLFNYLKSLADSAILTQQALEDINNKE